MNKNKCIGYAFVIVIVILIIVALFAYNYNDSVEKEYFANYVALDDELRQLT